MPSQPIPKTSPNKANRHVKTTKRPGEPYLDTTSRNHPPLKVQIQDITEECTNITQNRNPEAEWQSIQTSETTVWEPVNPAPTGATVEQSESLDCPGTNPILSQQGAMMEHIINIAPDDEVTSESNIVTSTQAGAAMSAQTAIIAKIAVKANTKTKYPSALGLTINEVQES